MCLEKQIYSLVRTISSRFCTNKSGSEKIKALKVYERDGANTSTIDYLLNRCIFELGIFFWLSLNTSKIATNNHKLITKRVEAPSRGNCPPCPFLNPAANIQQNGNNSQWVTSRPLYIPGGRKITCKNFKNVRQFSKFFRSKFAIRCLKLKPQTSHDKNTNKQLLVTTERTATLIQYE